MVELKSNRIHINLPWIIAIAMTGAFSLYIAIYKPDYNSFTTQSAKVELLSTLRIHLLESIEAEKNAVLAITDEESEVYANQARQANNQVETSRKEIETIILREKNSKERDLIGEFNSCWSQYRKLDETILDLAIQNTNLKAQKISLKQCAEEISELEESLNRLIYQERNDNQINNIVKYSYEVLTASLKIFALHKPHIDEADDKQMDKIEQSIKTNDEIVKKALNSLSNLTALKDNSDLGNAKAAYQQFMNLTGQVLRLSRMNTNIKSAELSLGKKRLISSQCKEILATLQEKIHAQGSYLLPRSK